MMLSLARPRWRPAAAIAALAAFAVIAPGSPVAAAEQVVLSAGHTDAVDVHFTGGVLSLRVHDDTVSPSVYRDPADVTFQAVPQSAIEVPDDPAYAFLGEPGATVWVLPQVQQEDLLWPGWNTTTLDSGVFQGNQVRLSLDHVEGPGQVWVFMVDPFGAPLMKFSTSDGLPDVLDVPVHTHAHANWAFSALGSYTLTFQAEATLIDGTVVSTGPVPYRFVVGDLPAGTALSIEGLAASYTPGQQVTLTAAQTPPSGLTDYRWDRKCSGDSSFTEVAGETGAQYQFTATEALNGCLYQARLLDAGTTVATAPAATLIVAAAPAPGASQLITVTLDDSAGALVVSVDPADRTVALPALALSPAGDRWESAGILRPVRVTDTRASQPGWNVTGQITGGFTSATGGFPATHLGWAPQILSQAPSQGVSAGPVVSPLLSGGSTGLSASCVLGTAVAGAGRGTASLGANLSLQLPTETAGGSYAATLVLTVI